MEPSGEFDSPQRSQRFGGGPHKVGVHVLSEFVFCPRAALLAYESEADSGEDELFLGPRLGGFEDYNEHLFAEALHQSWGDLRLWLTLMAPSSLVVLIAWQLHSWFAGLLVSLPFLYLAARSWETSLRIVSLIRERAIFHAAVPVEIDMAPTDVVEVNWWSLLKSGFDCFKLQDSLMTTEERLNGKRWRVLKKGSTISIPVIRRHRGKRDWGRQHVVRIAAYCRLIERCEGRSAPFGVILFAGSYDCVIIPNTAAAMTQFEEALGEVREFLELHDKGTHVPAEPTDNRCAGCPYGKPVRYKRGKTETVLNGVALVPFTTDSRRESDGQFRGTFHCPCGDRFKWVPRHRDAEALNLTRNG